MAHDDDGDEGDDSVGDNNVGDDSVVDNKVGDNNVGDDNDGEVVVDCDENIEVVIDEVLISLKALPTSSTILFRIIVQALRMFSSSPTTVTHLSGREKSVHFCEI